jgi:hypothetical protein
MGMVRIVCPPNRLLTMRRRDTDLLAGNLPQIRKSPLYYGATSSPESEPRFA